MFKIRMGILEMRDFWEELVDKKKNNKLGSNEIELFKRLAKAIKFLSYDSKHSRLQTHEIKPLSKKYGLKIWQSYLDQGKKACRVSWTYGPNRKEITVLGIEPYPEDKKWRAHKRIKLSKLPEN